MSEQSTPSRGCCPSCNLQNQPRIAHAICGVVRLASLLLALRMLPPFDVASAVHAQDSWACSRYTPFTMQGYHILPRSRNSWLWSAYTSSQAGLQQLLTLSRILMNCEHELQATLVPDR